MEGESAKVCIVILQYVMYILYYNIFSQRRLSLESSQVNFSVVRVTSFDISSTSVLPLSTSRFGWMSLIIQLPTWLATSRMEFDSRQFNASVFSYSQLFQKGFFEQKTGGNDQSQRSQWQPAKPLRRSNT